MGGRACRNATKAEEAISRLRVGRASCRRQLFQGHKQSQASRFMMRRFCPGTRIQPDGIFGKDMRATDQNYYRIRPNLNSDHFLLRVLANADAAAILNSIIQPHRDAH
jgi:hypothetical protein